MRSLPLKDLGKAMTSLMLGAPTMMDTKRSSPGSGKAEGKLKMQKYWQAFCNHILKICRKSVKMCSPKNRFRSNALLGACSRAQMHTGTISLKSRVLEQSQRCQVISAGQSIFARSMTGAG